MTFEITPDVDVHRDQDGRLRSLRHTREAYTQEAAGLEGATPVEVARQYVRDVAELYGISGEETTALERALDGEPAPEPTRLKEDLQRTVIDTTVVKYQQTHLGLPVWNSTFTVIVAGDPPAVVSSNSTLQQEVTLPATSSDALAGLVDFTPASLDEAIGVDDAVGDGFSLNGVRLLVYRYDPGARIDLDARTPAPTGGPTSDTASIGAQQPTGPAAVADGAAGPTGPTSAGLDDVGPASAGDPGPGPDGPSGAAFTDTGSSSGPAGPGDAQLAFQAGPPTLPLPPVPDSIEPGRDYVVREVLFTLSLPAEGELNWRAFVEPGSGAVLYLRALTAGATCAVFETDPITRTGQALTPASPAAQLDAARTLGLELTGLDAPSGGSQSLSGPWARLQDTDPPAVAPPTTTSPFAFEYSAVTDDFSGANAYYHTDWMYRFVEGLGFDVASYFDGTDFPVPVDHRGKNGALNASANGNATGDGMGRFLYGVAQSGQPVGIATTIRVCLHEFGHALLWDHVDSPNFGWAHSAGDTLAAILNDPGSLAPDRFATFPFVTAGTPGLDRRHDRDVAAGWAWGGSRDNRQYGSEQILSSLLFRVYRVTGGDDVDVDVQRFAARYLSYLVIRAIGTLTATTTDPTVFVTALRDADELTGTFEGHAGGAWHKVLRWSFEQQGLFQPPGAPTPVTQPGAPPAVDVFIDDGRQGGYEPYLTDIGSSPGLWNRLAADGGTTHQDPVAGQTNHLYVRVGNRGTSSATSVTVAAFQSDAGSAQEWPGDWSPLDTASVGGPNIASGGEAVVGPFAWTPAGAGVSVLASASAAGDPSNADTVNGPISNRRLVPNDNNLAQLDVDVSGGGGGCLEIGSGATSPGATAWQAYGSEGLVLDVDTTSAGFTRTPRYVTTIGGSSSHWATTGATSIYGPTTSGFRVYVRWAGGGAITPAQANQWKWHISWIGVVDG